MPHYNTFWTQAAAIKLLIKTPPNLLTNAHIVQIADNLICIHRTGDINLIEVRPLSCVKLEARWNLKLDDIISRQSKVLIFSKKSCI